MSSPKRTVVTVVVIAVAGIALMLIAQSMLGVISSNTTADVAAVEGEIQFADGSPAEGAQVTVVWRDAGGAERESVASTDADGRFRIQELATAGSKEPESVSEVRVAFGPLAASVEAGELPRGIVQGVRVKRRLPDSFDVAGLVRHGPDRDPVPGAKLECAGVTATADGAGAFRLRGIHGAAFRARRLVLRVTADGFTTLDWPVPRDWLPPQYGDVALTLERLK